jgi:hypothetical protein
VLLTPLFGAGTLLASAHVIGLILETAIPEARTVSRLKSLGTAYLTSDTPRFESKERLGFFVLPSPLNDGLEVKP